MSGAHRATTWRDSRQTRCRWRRSCRRLEDLLTADARACYPELIVAPGSAAGEVLRVVRESDAGLIVLGVHGRNALDRAIFGSTSQRVVREASCAVLTVKA